MVAGAVSVFGVIGGPAIFHQLQVEILSLQDDIGQEPAVFTSFLSLKFKGDRFSGQPCAGIVRCFFTHGGVSGKIWMDRFRGIYIEQSDFFFFAVKINHNGITVHHPQHLMGLSMGWQGKY